MFCKCQNKSSRSQFLRSCKNAPVFRTLGPHLVLSAPSATVGDIIKSLLPGSPEYVVPPLQSNNNNPGAIRNSQYKQVLRRPELGMSATASVEVRGRRGRPVSSIRSLTNILYNCICMETLPGVLQLRTSEVSNDHSHGDYSHIFSCISPCCRYTVSQEYYCSITHINIVP